MAFVFSSTASPLGRLRPPSSPRHNSEYGYQYWTAAINNPPYVYKVSRAQPAFVRLVPCERFKFSYQPHLLAPRTRQVSPPQCKFPVTEGGPFTLTGSKTPVKHSVRAGKAFKVTFALTRWAAAYPYEPARRELAFATKVWEDYVVAITLPEQGVVLHGKPRVAPRIPKSKGADVVNNTLIAWNDVPMLVNAGSKNYTRKFSFAVKVDKTFVGSNLTFSAAATGPQEGWRRATTLTVPVTATGTK